MKKLLALILMAGIITSTQAAFHGYAGGAYHGGHTTVIVHGGYGYGYGPYYPYAGFGIYSPFYWNQPYGYYRPSKLDMRIADIKNDYADKIASVRMDKSLTGKEKRQAIRNFKTERDNTIDQTKKDYYKS